MAETNVASRSPGPLRDGTPTATSTGSSPSDRRHRARCSWTSKRRAGCAAAIRLKLNSYDLGVDIEFADALHAHPIRAPRREGARRRQRQALIASSARARTSTAARQLDARVQSELLQVHERDAPLPEDLSEGRRSSRASCALAGNAASGGGCTSSRSRATNAPQASTDDGLVERGEGLPGVSTPRRSFPERAASRASSTSDKKVRRDLARCRSGHARRRRSPESAPSNGGSSTKRRHARNSTKQKKRRAEALVEPIEAKVVRADEVETRSATNVQIRAVYNRREGADREDRGERARFDTAGFARGARKTGEAACGACAPSVEPDAALLDLRFNRPLVGTVAIETARAIRNAVLAVDARCSRSTRTTAS